MLTKRNKKHWGWRENGAAPDLGGPSPRKPAKARTGHSCGLALDFDLGLIRQFWMEWTVWRCNFPWLACGLHERVCLPSGSCGYQPSCIFGSFPFAPLAMVALCFLPLTGKTRMEEVCPKIEGNAFRLMQPGLGFGGGLGFRPKLVSNLTLRSCKSQAKHSLGFVRPRNRRPARLGGSREAISCPYGRWE